MSNDQSSTLMRKIESAHFDVSAYPQLETFANRLVTEFVAKVNEQIKGSIEIRGVRYTALIGARSLDGKDGAYALFASQTPNKAGSVLVSVAGNIAGAIAEAMFGGAFVLSENSNKPTDIDVAVLSMTLNKVLAQLAGNGRPQSGVHRQTDTLRVAPVSFASNDVKKISASTLCNVIVDIGFGEAQADSAVTFHLPMDFLDARGLLEKGRKREVADEEETHWRREMTANVESSEIQLDILLGAFTTRLSKLTELSVGETIPLPINADSASQIVLKTADGARTIGQGRLGAYKENKAIKLLSALDP